MWVQLGMQSKVQRRQLQVFLCLPGLGPTRIHQEELLVKGTELWDQPQEINTG